MSASKPLVSVIVPVYNGEKHLTATLNSIINQDYEDIEIIVVNDASTDNTLNLAGKVLKNSKRAFKIINHEKNLGVSAARNHGLDASNGEYIWFCDSDDLAEKNFVSSLYKEIEDTNADLVFCRIKYFYEAENKIENKPIKLKKKSLDPGFYLKAWAKGKLKFWSVWNFIFRKDFLIQNKLKFSEKFPLFEDGEFALKSVALSSKISFVNDELYIYVQHNEHSTTKYRTPKQLAYYGELAMWRAGRCIIRNCKDKSVKNYALCYCLAYNLLKKCKAAAQAGERGDYDRFIITLKHKKIRQVMLSTVKYIFYEPEVFFKALMLLYAPNLYYFLRK